MLKLISFRRVKKMRKFFENALTVTKKKCFNFVTPNHSHNHLR